MLMGLWGGAIGMAIYGLAPKGLLFWIGVPVMSLWGLAGPASQAMMSRLVSPSEQGQLQGANTAIMSIAGLIGPGLFVLSFSHFIEGRGPIELPGAPFLLAAALLFAATLLTQAVTAPGRSATPHP